MTSFVSMKRHAGIITLFFLVLLLASSCKKSTYYKLSDEDMSWLVYQNNELLQYDNGAGLQQSIRVTLRVKYYDKDGETYSESTAAMFAMQNDTTNYAADSKGGLNISTGENGLYVGLSWPHFAFPNYPIHNATQQPMTLGGYDYFDIIIVDATPIANSRWYVKTIWYSKSEGVVQYEDIYGNIWNKSI
jgi:hypothetical protein